MLNWLFLRVLAHVSFCVARMAFFMKGKLKRVALFCLKLLIIMNFFGSSAFSVSVICKNEDGSYKFVNHPRIVWTREENMYRGGVRTVFRVYLKFTVNGQRHQLIYDRLLSFLPHSSGDADVTITEIEGLARFIINSLPGVPPNFRLDSIDIFCTNHNGTGYKLDVVDVVVSPHVGGFALLPVINFWERYFPLSTYVAGF